MGIIYIMSFLWKWNETIYIKCYKDFCCCWNVPKFWFLKKPIIFPGIIEPKCLFSFYVWSFYFGSHSSEYFSAFVSDFLSLKINGFHGRPRMGRENTNSSTSCQVHNSIKFPQNNQGYHTFWFHFSFMHYLGSNLPIRGGFYINSVLSVML